MTDSADAWLERTTEATAEVREMLDNPTPEPLTDDDLEEARRLFFIAGGRMAQLGPRLIAEVERLRRSQNFPPCPLCGQPDPDLADVQ